MSHVYRATDTLMGRTVAVKVLTEAGAANEETKARFTREAQLAGSVIHDNIIRVYDFGDDAGQLFMVMEFLEGEDLNDSIRNGRTGSLEQRLNTAVQITRAMEHVHSLGIVHRDLKPHNVYMTKAGVAKLMDFGIAKTDQTSMTATGFTLGTPSYMAPEQVLGKQVNRLSDIYAFGILLFELVTGKKPLAGDTLERVFWQILNEPIDPAALREAGAPESVVDLVRKCTEKDPTKRPQSFTEVRQTLEEAMKKKAPAPTVAVPIYQPPPVELPPATRVVPTLRTEVARPPVPAPKKWLIPAAAGLGVLLLAGAFFALRKPAAKTDVPPQLDPNPTATTAPRIRDTPATLALPSGDMILIPGGQFLYGETKETRDLAPFYMDRTTVTNAAYGAFLKATGRTAPAGFAEARPEFPVVNVTIEDARAFAKYAGKRLPNVVEWEKGARGTDGRLYPWGDDKNPKLAAVEGGAPLRAADNADGKSPFGLLQMTGNVWQLIDQSITPSPGALRAMAKRLTPAPTADEPWCMMRGGSYDFPLVPVYEFSSIPERLRQKDIGFRCVRDVK
jgi:serine/threonine-protein kinase